MWMTLDLPAGEVYFINTTNPADEGGEDVEAIDKFVKVTVS